MMRMEAQACIPGDRQADSFATAIEALRTQGAERFDAAGFRFIEALARRAAAQPEDARRLLEHRLDSALAQFRGRLEQAREAADEALARTTTRFPAAADALRRCYEATDFAALQRLATRLETRGGPGPLAALLAHAGQPATSPQASVAAGGPVTHPQRELKSLRHFRRTWSKLSVDRQFSHAVARAPDNAGPLNSHHLALQALTQMRELSPAYVEQFISYIDALQWLDEANAGRSSARAKGTPRTDRQRKRKSTRGKTA